MRKSANQEKYQGCRNVKCQPNQALVMMLKNQSRRNVKCEPNRASVMINLYVELSVHFSNKI